MARSVCSVLVVVLVCAACGAQEDFVPLFNESDLSGWRRVNTAPSTWTVRDGMIVCSGSPIGELCTTSHYENFVLELEWRHMTEGGNAGLFVHSDPLPAVGQPFTRAIEAQVMDGNHGDVFAIHGATMVPDRPHPEGWMRSLPIEERANPTGEWNHYRLESHDGTVSLAVNGETVSGGSEISPRRGYICLESEGSEVHFRNIRIRELPSTDPPPEETADVYDGFRTLYDGVSLSGWKAGSQASWAVDDWVLRADSGGGSHLWTEDTYGDFELIADWRVECGADAPLPAEMTRSALLLRGNADARVLLGCGAALSNGGASEDALATASHEGADSRGWRRLRVRLVDTEVAVTLDGEEIGATELPADTRPRGEIGLAHYGAPVQFANLFVKELNQ